MDHGGRNVKTNRLMRGYALAAISLLAGMLGWYSTRLNTLSPATPRAEPVDIAANGGKTNDEWKALLTPEQYRILREKGTEVPYSSPLNDEKRPGTYVSADCGTPLFRSEDKYDSGTGWPSFTKPISPDALRLEEDRSLAWAVRTEVLDAKCGGHLGHVFEDGPPPDGLRYCMNGAALRFIPDEPEKD
jgi:peptide-methionine (R)-S-oxide reductase